MNQKLSFFKKIFIGVILLWTALIVLFIIINTIHSYIDADEDALIEAQFSTKKDLVYRSWIASHGGVYVPITERTPPNIYLSHIPNRDVQTTDGQNLTLMNPAYILSQMMGDYKHLYGVTGKITSLNPLNPKNKADEWEQKGLNIIEKTEQPFYEKSYIGEKEYLRYLNPLYVKKNCLKCHKQQGYKIGDLRGAVSVSIPLKEYKQTAFFHSLYNGAYFIVIWGVGIFGIAFGYKQIKRYLDEQIRNYEQHIYTLVDVIEKRDSYTAGHTKRVAKYSVLIAEQMGFNKETKELLFRASMLHDIGKISTPDSILLKPGKLSQLEYRLIQGHVTESHDLLKKVDIFEDIAEIVRHHHERYDGNGYPQGLNGDKIPILSQIMIVADAFDAMTTNRIYKARKSVKTAIEELKSLSGKQFHSEIVSVAEVVLKYIDIDTSENQLPQTELEQQRFSYFYKDLITGAYNRDYLEFVLSRRINQIESTQSDNNENYFEFQCCYAILLHHFTQYNKKNGWKQGDKLLNKFAETLEFISEKGMIFRLYGDDFILLHANHFELEQNLSTIEKLLDGTEVTISYKHFHLDKEKITSLSELENKL